MKLFTVFFLFLNINSCYSQQSATSLRGFQATSLFPIFSESGEVKQYDTGIVKVYYWGNRRLYDLQYTFNSIEKGEVRFSEKRRHLVAFIIDSSHGYDFNLTSGVKKRVRLDSLFKTQWIAQNKIYPILTVNIAILTSSTHSADSGLLVEHYLIKNREDSTEIGECTFSYTNRISGIDISLSKELDSLKQMKLFKTKIVSLPRHFKENNFTIGRYETGATLKEIAIPDEKTIRSQFSTLLDTR
jgi:hypothetical protein